MVDWKQAAGPREEARVPARRKPHLLTNPSGGVTLEAMMDLTKDETLQAQQALKDRAAWAAARGFFWLSERDCRMLERLDVGSRLSPADVRHLGAVLRRVGGPDNEAFAKRLGLRS